MARLRPADLAVGLLTAPRDPPHLPITVAKHIAANVDMNSTHLFALQSHGSARDTTQRLALKNLGFHTFALSEDYKELGNDVSIPLTWVCVLSDDDF
jgi:hypothetical protein